MVRPGAAVRLVLSAWLLAAGAPVGAQDPRRSPLEERWVDATWVDDLNFMAANALVSGLVTGIFAAVDDDRTFAEGFLTGAAAGGVVYAGKRVAAGRFGGAGLLGRQMTGLGVSLLRNARDGRGLLDEIVFPVGLARVYWDRAGGSVAVKPDLYTLYWLGVGSIEDGAELDWQRSLSAGAPVFLTRGAALDGASGQSFGGVILVDRYERKHLDDIFAHERVHVLQWDHQYGLWAERVEGWAASLLGSPARAVFGWVDVGLAPRLIMGPAFLLPNGANPFQVEAHYLEVR